MELNRLKIFKLDEASEASINEFLSGPIQVANNGITVEGDKLVIAYTPSGASRAYGTEEIIVTLELGLNEMLAKRLGAEAGLRNAQAEVDAKKGGKGAQEAASINLSSNEKNVAGLDRDIAVTRAIIKDMQEGKLVI